MDPEGTNPLLAVPILIGGYLGTTQTANAPGPGAATSNDAPLFEPMFAASGLATGIGPAASAGGTLLRTGVSLADDVATQGAFAYGAGASIVRSSAQRVMAKAVTSPNLTRNAGRGLGALAFAGAANEATVGFDTGGFSGVDFTAGGSFGMAIETGLTAFDLGGAAVQSVNGISNFIGNTALPAATDFYNSWSTGPLYDFSSPGSNHK